MEFLLSVLVPDSFYDFVATVVIFTFYVFLFLIGVSERFLSLYGVSFQGAGVNAAGVQFLHVIPSACCTWRSSALACAVTLKMT
ncbi:hypothetical protein FO131_06445 [Salmonella bongori]|uniref:hypothetical protein n=1 Tax=Salmonella bongori TaxID=54736 RepID=UPI001273CF83|nr:hypothetical protein [Salmonella bongori]ECG8257534.1 hypothetical protein [Salmonella bongori serovar 48:i:-]ECG9252203.1 hypothetical protein [Salmonella bongori]EDP8708851.1 hypothetical protein [Salmonella bongori]EDP8726826.1 hypothetical protein [Salmonella bongori]EEO9372199.1 hypothetical protein [Salmonella bongori]